MWISQKSRQIRPIVGTIRSYSTSRISLTSTRIALSWDILIIPAPSLICRHRPISCTLVAQTPKMWTIFSGAAVKFGDRRKLNSNDFHFRFGFFSFSFVVSFSSAFPFPLSFLFFSSSFSVQLNLNAHCHWECHFHLRHFNQL
jgi:hypothetical protein